MTARRRSQQASKKPNVKVLFVGTEFSPFSKVGGLGDVMGSLPKALRKRGIDVRVVTPAWPGVLQKVRGSGYKIVDFQQQRISTAYGWKVAEAAVRCVNVDGVMVYFLRLRRRYVSLGRSRWYCRPFCHILYAGTGAGKSDEVVARHFSLSRLDQRFFAVRGGMASPLSRVLPKKRLDAA